MKHRSLLWLGVSCAINAAGILAVVARLRLTDATPDVVDVLVLVICPLALIANCSELRKRDRWVP